MKNIKINPIELQHKLKNIKESLRHTGVKLTHQRLVILREVAKFTDHPDAETIYKSVRKKLPTVSLDTVYRTLWLLLDLGLITTLGPSRERIRFDTNTRSHHHFICNLCGMTHDFYSKEFDELKIPNTLKALGESEKLQVEVKGLCLQCLKKKKNKKHKINSV